MFERYITPANLTYLDDIGIPNATLNVSFDGQLVPGGIIEKTGNSTTRIDPFGEYGNGSFKFILDIDKPAGEYGLVVRSHYDPSFYNSLTFEVILYINHPTTIDMDISPITQVVGQNVTISGDLSDETGRPVPNVPLQIWFDDALLGPSSDGVYIDDLSVEDAGFSDDFEAGDANGWSTFVAPGRTVGNQWEHGTPGTGYGPRAPHSGSQLWGTVLNGNYQRGAWSFLVTPRMNFTANRTYALSFWAWWSVYWNEDYVYVLASMDGGATWDEAGAMKFMGTKLVSGDWTLLEYNVTKYVGSDNVKFAFVFLSVDKSLDVRTDGTYGYRHFLPMDTEADSHDVRVIFNGDLVHRFSTMKKTIVVKRIAHFEFEANTSLKVGHRNQALNLTSKLVDNMGEVLKANINGILYIYPVAIYWEKVWRIDGLVREPIGPPSTMDPRTGIVSDAYAIAFNQTLRPCNVTFRFGGSDFYTNATGLDIYFVKANVYLHFPDTEDFIRHRGQPLNISPELRIVPDQSINDEQIGDPISGEYVDTWWGSERIGSRRDFPKYDYIVPINHTLGDVVVTFEYRGQPFYEPITFIMNYTIVSDTFITLEGKKVHKGEWCWINGTIKDDGNKPLTGVSVDILWDGIQEVGRTTSGPDGLFALKHFVEFEDSVGNVTGIARYIGNGTQLDGKANATFIVKVGTILQRCDRIMSVVLGEQAQFTGKLFEDWNGIKGVEVQHEEMTLYIDGIFIEKKYTAFDGTATFTASIDPAVFSYGELPLVLEFNGTEFYDPSRRPSSLVVCSDSIMSFTQVRVDGMHIDPTKDFVKRGDEVTGRILLQDTRFQPISNATVNIYYKEAGLRARKRLIGSGVTDGQGYTEFRWTFNINTEGNKTLVAEYEGLAMDSIYKDGDIIIRPSTAEFEFTYIGIGRTQEQVRVIGDLSVRVGEGLRLIITPSYPSRWNLTGLNYSLVSGPEGMVLHPDGSITWKPGIDHVGEHIVQVRLDDGDNNVTTTFTVTVKKGMLGELVLVVAFVAILVIVAAMAIGRRRRRRPSQVPA